MTLTREQVVDALRPVEDPELHRSIVDIGMLRDVAVSPDGSRIVYGTDQGVYVLEVASGEATRRADGVLGLWAK